MAHHILLYTLVEHSRVQEQIAGDGEIRSPAATSGLYFPFAGKIRTNTVSGAGRTHVGRQAGFASEHMGQAWS